MEKEVLSNIKKEIEKIKEDSLYSAKGYFEDAKYWRYCNYILVISSIVSVCASLAFSFLDFYATFASQVSLLSAFITMILVFLDSQEKYTSHQNSGNDYLALRNQAGYFINIERHNLATKTQIERLRCFVEKRDLLNKKSLSISSLAYKNAKRQIEIEKSHEYRID